LLAHTGAFGSELIQYSLPTAVFGQTAAAIITTTIAATTTTTTTAESGIALVQVSVRAVGAVSKR